MAPLICDNVHPFVKIEDPAVLIPVLERRLPFSALVYNSAKMYPRVVSHCKAVGFYTLFGDVDETAWIVYLHYREDCGMDYLISADEKQSKISREEAIRILSTSKLFNWDESYLFAVVEKWISSIVFEVSVNVKGCATMVHPCKLFYWEREECLRFDVKIDTGHGINTVLKPLDLESGVQFILNTWKYAIEKSDIVIKRALKLHESAAVYVDGKPVCGVLTQDFGMISALYTLQDYRNRGFGEACMKSVCKEQAKNGLVPASPVELKNEASMMFHEKRLGCKAADVFYSFLYVKKDL